MLTTAVCVMIASFAGFVLTVRYSCEDYPYEGDL